MNFTRVLPAMILALVAFVGSTPAKASVVSYTIDTYIDFQDNLYIQGNKLWWVASTACCTPVGEPRSDVPFTTTNVTTTIDGNTDQSFQWQPVYIPGSATTYSYTGLSPALPELTTPVTLDVLEGRYSLTILQQPDAADNYTLALDFDDTAPAGAAEYIAKVSYDTGVSAVPLPGALPMFAAALAGLAGWGLRSRRTIG